MNRPGRTSLAVVAVSAAAVIIPLGAFAAGGSGSAGCAAERGAVSAAQSTVSQDRAALTAASGKKAKSARAKAEKRKAVAEAAKRLAAAESALNAAQEALIACQDARPTPTATATSTAIPGHGGKAPVDGTTLFPMTESDGTAIAANGRWDGTTIVGSGFGSGLTPDAADGPGWFYGITDRGPNVGGPDGVKMDPVQGFQPAIGKFHLENGHAELTQVIGLKGFSGSPMNGLVPPDDANAHGTGSDIEDQYGATAPRSALGIDSESIAVDPAGGFFVSDEYGPYIVHLDASGKETYRYSPYVSAEQGDGTTTEKIYPLPGELVRRKENKGMEGMTITPDGQYLVGIMQSPLDGNNGDGTAAGSGTSAGKGAIARIVRVKLSDHSVQEYLYALHVAASNATSDGEANSEITALDDAHFVVDERDGCFEGANANDFGGDGGKCTGAAIKNLWRIDLSSATDVGPASAVSGATYSATSGLNIGGKSIEDIAAKKSGVDAVAALAAVGITTVDDGNPATAPYLNYAGLVDHIDPTGQYFGHDKVEGVAIDPADPNIVYLADDSDFGITDVPADSNWPADSISHGGEKRVMGSDALKRLPGPDGIGTGGQDFGEIMRVDLSRVPAAYKG